MINDMNYNIYIMKIFDANCQLMGYLHDLASANGICVCYVYIRMLTDAVKSEEKQTMSRKIARYSHQFG